MPNSKDIERRRKRAEAEKLRELHRVLKNRMLNTTATDSEKYLDGGVLAYLFGEDSVEYSDSNDPENQDGKFKPEEETEEENDDEIEEMNESAYTGFKRKRKNTKDKTPTKKAKLHNNENNRKNTSTGPSISIVTWNIEKLGKSTDLKILRKKSETIGRILDQLQPMIMVMQEVTNSQLLLEGDEQMGLSGLKKIDVLESYREDVLYPFHFQSGIKSLLAVLTNPELKRGTALAEQFKKLSNQLNTIENESIEEFVILINKTFKQLLKLRTTTTSEFNQLLDDFIRLLKSKDQSDLDKQNFNLLLLEPTNNPFDVYLFFPVDQIKQFHKNFNNKDRKDALRHIIDTLDKNGAIFSNNFLKSQFLEEFMQPYYEEYNVIEEKRVLDLLAEMEFYSNKGEHLKDKYELSSQYAMLKGPRFIAGVELNTMSDFYPVFYNKAVIHSPPELSVLDLENGEIKTLNYHEYQHTFRYGEVTKEQVEDVLKKLENELSKLKIRAEKNATSLSMVKNKLDIRLEKKLSTAVDIHIKLLERLEKLTNQDVILKSEVDTITTTLETKKSIIIETATHEKTGDTVVVKRDNNNLDQSLKINRKLVLWKFKIPVNRYYLRPETSSIPFGSRNYLKYTELYVGVVHTSPSLDITKEITAIMNGAEKLSKETSIPILLSGDWYMEKKMKTEFTNLQNNEHSDWVLIAPENNTNIPGLGKKGQIADHFLGKKGEIEKVKVSSLPPSSFVRGSGEEMQDEWLRHYDMDVYNQWRNITVDHTPVYGLVNIIFKNNIDNIEKMKITEIAGQFTRSKVFGERTVLQEYVTKHDTGTFVEKGGMPTIQELGAGEYVIMTSTIAQVICPQSQGFPLIRLNTSELAYTQLLTGPKPTDDWSCAKGSLKLNNNLAVVTKNSSAEMYPKQSDIQGKMKNNACIYALNITKGFGIILAAKDADQWHASVGCNATMSISDDKLEAMKFDQIQDTSNYYAVIAINCLFKNDNLNASIAVLLNQLETIGVSSQQVTIYKSYATYENIAVSIGIDTHGRWGEVVDQNQDPYSIWT